MAKKKTNNTGGNSPCIFELISCETQEKTSNYVKNFLTENKIKFYEDEHGNIYNLDNVGVPLLSAHMDTVMKETDMKLASEVKPDGTKIILTGGICGGDDKCGVYIILNALKNKRLINFIFSTDEEIGCVGIRGFLANKENVREIEENCLYCLVLDRKGDNDIICYANEYGTEEFENALVEVSKNNGFNFKSEIGLFSDADFLSLHISTANLSVGYFNPHSAKEYVDIDAMERSERFVNSILDEVIDKYEAPEKNAYQYYGSLFDDDYYSGSYYDNPYTGKKLVCDFCGTPTSYLEHISLTTPYNDLVLCTECATNTYEQLGRELAYYYEDGIEF